MWTYERSQQGFAAPDKLRCLGPTNEPLYLYVRTSDSVKKLLDRSQTTAYSCHSLVLSNQYGDRNKVRLKGALFVHLTYVFKLLRLFSYIVWESVLSYGGDSRIHGFHQIEKSVDPAGLLPLDRRKDNKEVMDRIIDYQQQPKQTKLTLKRTFCKRAFCNFLKLHSSSFKMRMLA